MNNFLLMILIVGAISMISCGDDDCTTADFEGTWNLQSQNCQDTSVSFDDQIVFSANANGNIENDGVEYVVVECSASTVTVFGNITVVVDGNEMSVSGLGCDATYTK